MKRLLSGIIILLLLLSGCGTKAGGTEDPPAISTPCWARTDTPRSTSWICCWAV